MSILDQFKKIVNSMSAEEWEAAQQVLSDEYNRRSAMDYIYEEQVKLAYDFWEVHPETAPVIVTENKDEYPKWEGGRKYPPKSRVVHNSETWSNENPGLNPREPGTDMSGWRKLDEVGKGPVATDILPPGAPAAANPLT